MNDYRLKAVAPDSPIIPLLIAGEALTEPIEIGCYVPGQRLAWVLVSLFHTDDDSREVIRQKIGAAVGDPEIQVSYTDNGYMKHLLSSVKYIEEDEAGHGS